MLHARSSSWLPSLRWCLLGCKLCWPGCLALTEQFLGSHGRGVYVKPFVCIWVNLFISKWCTKENISSTECSLNNDAVGQSPCKKSMIFANTANIATSAEAAILGAQSVWSRQSTSCFPAESTLVTELCLKHWTFKTLCDHFLEAPLMRKWNVSLPATWGNFYMTVVTRQIAAFLDWVRQQTIVRRDTRLDAAKKKNCMILTSFCTASPSCHWSVFSN